MRIIPKRRSREVALRGILIFRPKSFVERNRDNSLPFAKEKTRAVIQLSVNRRLYSRRHR